MPATLYDGHLEAAFARLNEEVVVDGDLKALCVYTIHADGSRSLDCIHPW